MLTIKMLMRWLLRENLGGQSASISVVIIVVDKAVPDMGTASLGVLADHVQAHKDSLEI